jgi:2-dehydropantoate 2-reductase
MSSIEGSRVAVVGAGAVGGFFGGMLARAGAAVTLIGRPSHVEVWKRGGLFIDGVNFQETIPVDASTDIDACRDAELVLFSVKTRDTEATARALAPHLHPDAIVVSLQNGVDNVERMRAVAGLDPVAAVVYVASTMPGPGRITHGGRGDLIIGDLPGRSAPSRGNQIARVAAWFETAGVPCRIAVNIEADLWAKLITNVALNAISAVVQATYGDIVNVPESREMIRRLVDECVAVAGAAGVPLPDMDFGDSVLRFAEAVGPVYSSTAQDLAKGRLTEIDTLNGFIVQRGRERRVPTPVNHALLALVRLREAQVLAARQ